MRKDKKTWNHFRNNYWTIPADAISFLFISWNGAWFEIKLYLAFHYFIVAYITRTPGSQLGAIQKGPLAI